MNELVMISKSILTNDFSIVVGCLKLSQFTFTLRTHRPEIFSVHNQL